MKIVLLLSAALVVSTFSCHRNKTTKQETKPMELISTDFIANQTIPDTFSCKSSAETFPSLQWSNAPSGTKSFAIIMDDPDAIPVAGHVWDHWVIFDIPSNINSIARGSGKCGPFPSGAVQGQNSFGNNCYGGPCPPSGQTHHYHFRLFALDTTTLKLNTGASSAQVRTAMKGKVLDSIELVGLFKQ